MVLLMSAANKASGSGCDGFEVAIVDDVEGLSLFDVFYESSVF